MRPSFIFLFCLLSLAVVDLGLYAHFTHSRKNHTRQLEFSTTATSALGLTDLCVSTEARYTRHPAVSDPMAPFMDHPGAIEHFPTGSYWVPVTRTINNPPIHPVD